MHKNSGIQNCITDLKNSFEVSDSYHITDVSDNIKIECGSCVMKTGQKSNSTIEMLFCFVEFVEDGSYIAVLNFGSTFAGGGDSGGVYLHGNPVTNAVIPMAIHCGRGKNTDGEMVASGCSIMEYVRKFV